MTLIYSEVLVSSMNNLVVIVKILNESSSKIENMSQCGICYERNKDHDCSVCTFSCCEECLISWTRTSYQCPQCREYMTYDITYSLVNNIVELVNISDEENEEDDETETYVSEETQEISFFMDEMTNEDNVVYLDEIYELEYYLDNNSS